MQDKDRLEQIVQQQRKQMFFASRLWLEEREENVRLREINSVLQAKLEQAGVFPDVPPAPDEQPMFAFTPPAE